LLFACDMMTYQLKLYLYLKIVLVAFITTHFVDGLNSIPCSYTAQPKLTIWSSLKPHHWLNSRQDKLRLIHNRDRFLIEESQKIPTDNTAIIFHAYGIANLTLIQAKYTGLASRQCCNKQHSYLRYGVFRI